MPNSLRFATTFALVLMPLLTFAASRQGAARPAAGKTFAVTVNVTCALTLSPGGDFAFASISALNGSAAQTTAENDAKVSCTGVLGPSRLAITDASLTGTPTYNLVSGAHKIAYRICPTASLTAQCYTNSTTGIPVVNNSTTKMFGYLPAQGKNAPGNYSDTVTVTLTF